MIEYEIFCDRVNVEYCQNQNKTHKFPKNTSNGREKSQNANKWFCYDEITLFYVGKAASTNHSTFRFFTSCHLDQSALRKSSRI